MDALKALIKESADLVDGLFLLDVVEDDKILLDALREKAQTINLLLNKVKEINTKRGQ
jgi:hypothetical protein